MMKDAWFPFASGLLIGLLLAIFGMGWFGAERLLAAERATADRWAVSVGRSQLVMDAALAYALKDPVERGLAWAEGVAAVSRAQKAPAIRNDVPPHIKRGK